MRRSKKQARTRRAGAIEQPANDIPAVPYKIGYARVSTEDQDLAMQIASLEKAGCNLIFQEKVSSVNAKRPQFREALKQLQPGDTLVVYSFSRLHRRVDELRALFARLKEKSVTLVSLTEALDVNTSHGKFAATIIAAVDEAERDRIAERTSHGMAEKKRQGMYLGRPKLISDKVALVIAEKLQHTAASDLARKYKVSPSTISNAAKRAAALSR